MLIKSVLSLFVVAVMANPAINRAMAGEKDLLASEVRVSTPVYQPSFSHFDPPLGTYTFTSGWEGIPAAEIKVLVDQQGTNYRIITTAKTYSGIDLFYKLRYRGESLLSAVDLSPVRTVIDQQENSKIRNTQIEFFPNGDIESVRVRVGGKPEVMRFNPENNTLDPFSSAFLARSMDWDVGRVFSFDSFNGKSRYLITLTCIGREEVRAAGADRDAWVISPTVKNLTSPYSDSKLRSAKIYVATDDSRDILKLVSSVFIGSVSTKLDSFEPSNKRAEPTLLALRAKAHRVL